MTASLWSARTIRSAGLVLILLLVVGSLFLMYPTGGAASQLPSVRLAGAARGTRSPDLVARERLVGPDGHVSGAGTPNPTGSGQTVGVETLSFTLPAGWRVYQTRACFAIIKNSGDTVTMSIANCRLSKPMTALQVQQNNVSQLNKYPDVKNCSQSGGSSYPVGKPARPGSAAVYCFTRTDQAGGSWRSYFLNWVGTSNGGKNVYEFYATGSLSAYSRDRRVFSAIANSIRWLR